MRRVPRSSTAASRPARSRATKPATSSHAGSSASGNVAAAALLIAVVALVVFVRFRYADVPLERDEGEYAYAGQLILDGTPPYTAAYNMKFPGTYYAYAALMKLFGETPSGIRVGLLLVNLISIALVFAIGMRLTSFRGACAAAVTFALLSLDRGAMGVFAHATHFVVPFVTAGFFVLLSAMRSGRAWQFVIAGVLMGLGVVMKQQALFLALAAVALAGVRPRFAWRPAIFVVIGEAIAMLLLVAIMSASGVLDRFWFWTIDYAQAYATGTPASVAIEVFGMAWSMVAGTAGWLWYAGLVGLLALAGRSWSGEPRNVILVWLIASVICVSTGFFFRPHYFILAMPVVAVLVGVLSTSIERALSRSMSITGAALVAVAVIAAAAGGYVATNSHFLFRMNATELMRSVYGGNPFLESPAVGAYLAAHTEPADRVAVFGSEPQILFYAQRRSATGYIYMYPLTERHVFASRMQDEFIAEIESNKPAYAVLIGARSSWVATLQPDLRIHTWVGGLLSRCYDRTGVVDIDPNGATTMLWDGASRGYEPKSPFGMMVYTRKGC